MVVPENRQPQADGSVLRPLCGLLEVYMVIQSLPWREAFPELNDDDLPAISLRAARRREGLTQKKLAELSGIPQAHISLMERGKMAIGVTRAKRLGKALDTGYKLFL